MIGLDGLKQIEQSHLRELASRMEVTGRRARERYKPQGQQRHFLFDPHFDSERGENDGAILFAVLFPVLRTLCKHRDSCDKE